MVNKNSLGWKWCRMVRYAQLIEIETVIKADRNFWLRTREDSLKKIKWQKVATFNRKLKACEEAKAHCMFYGAPIRGCISA